MNSHNVDATLLGMDIGGTQIRVALARGQQIFASKATLWPPDLTPADEICFIADFALRLVNEADLGESVSGVGVALAAQIDTNGVVVQWPNRSLWQGLEFKSLLTKLLDMPVVVEDDANAAALAEWTIGTGQACKHALVLTVGTGVGSGLILNGELFRGRNGWAGEIGHMIMLQDGPICPCGRRGCLQMLASGRALERVALSYGLTGASDVTLAAEAGVSWAQHVLKSCGDWLGLAAANVVNLLDLEAVIVSSGFVLADPLWGALEETLQKNVLNRQHQHVLLQRSTLSNTASLLGAVWLAQYAV